MTQTVNVAPMMPPGIPAQHFRRAVAGEEADKLQHKNERAGCRLGKAKASQHFGCGQPLVGLDRILRDIGQDGVSPTDGDHGHLGKEPSDVGVGPAHGRHQHDDRHQP